MDALGAKTTGQVLLRLGVFIFVVNVISWLDRANVSFAALDMNADLAFDPKIYGLGVGLFSITHILFQLPYAEAAARLGCRRTLAFMMIFWGSLAACMGLIQNAEQFYLVRLLLGVAEAGIGPVTLFYATRWIPQERMGSFMIWIMLSVPFGVLLGAPLSGLLIVGTHDFLGVPGWRWMFLIEGLPAILLGFFALNWLTEQPQDARWLAPERKAWLINHLRKTNAVTDHGGGLRNLGWILRDAKVWTCGIILFCIVTCLQGMLYWMPQVVHQLTDGADRLTVIILSALPWLGSAAGMVTVALNSDRSGERHFHMATCLLLGASALVASFLVGNPTAALIALTIGLFGIGGAQAVYMTLPMQYLRGRPGSALALTSVNFIGFSAGLISPVIIGRIREATGGFQGALYFMAGALAVGALIVLLDRFSNKSGDASAPSVEPA